MDTQLKRVCIVKITTVTEPGFLLTSDMGQEIHHPIMSMIWGYGGCLERDRERES